MTILPEGYLEDTVKAVSKLYEAKLVGEGLADLEQGRTVDGAAVRKKLGEKYGF